jgi:hypothetical protein
MPKEFVFEINTARAKAYKGGRYTNRKNRSLTALIVQALLRRGKLTATELVAAVKRAGYKTKPQYLRPDTMWTAKLLCNARVISRRKDRP